MRPRSRACPAPVEPQDGEARRRRQAGQAGITTSLSDRAPPWVFHRVRGPDNVACPDDPPRRAFLNRSVGCRTETGMSIRGDRCRTMAAAAVPSDDYYYFPEPELSGFEMQRALPR